MTKWRYILNPDLLSQIIWTQVPNWSFMQNICHWHSCLRHNKLPRGAQQYADAQACCLAKKCRHSWPASSTAKTGDRLDMRPFISSILQQHGGHRLLKTIPPKQSAPHARLQLVDAQACSSAAGGQDILRVREHMGSGDVVNTGCSICHAQHFNDVS